MKKKKQPVVMRYDFLNEEQVPIQIVLEKRRLKLTAEILFAERCVCLEEADIEETYWIKSFEKDGQRYLIVIEEVDLGESYAVTCYQNGKALSDGIALDTMRAKILDPFFGMPPKARRNDLLFDIIGNIVVVLLAVLIFGSNLRWWENLIFFVLFLGGVFFHDWRHRRRRVKIREMLAKSLDDATV